MTIQTVIVEYLEHQEGGEDRIFFLEESPEVVKSAIEHELDSIAGHITRTVYSFEEYISLQTRPMSDFCPPKLKKGIWWLAVPDVTELIGDIEGAMWWGKQAVKHHHVTLAYDVTEEDEPNLSFRSSGGRTWYAIEVKGLAYNDKCAALVIDLRFNNEHCCNKHPHITLATADGVKPVYSNDMLAGVDGAYNFLPLEVELEGQLEFFEFS